MRLEQRKAVGRLYLASLNMHVACHLHVCMCARGAAVATIAAPWGAWKEQRLCQDVWWIDTVVVPFIFLYTSYLVMEDYQHEQARSTQILCS